MTTRMAMRSPSVEPGKVHPSQPLHLDNRIAYGNLPRWIVDGMDVPKDVRISQMSYAKELRANPPLYAGNSTGIIRSAPQPRPDPLVKPHTLKTPWAGEGDDRYTAYISRKQSEPNLTDSPYAYSASHLGEQPKRSWKYNVYNTHAKQGFKFWLEEKKPINKSQKYTFGSTKTFLGLGNGPRN
ncbi:uncharacterized protein LOC110977675 [Acanthaster planci]|uniref:Uncharacterized protein LOC110977675 n=1 Tax=Acanthaster planci TaxID=133434 RepID=A0A8B7Y5P7_ACAPL|nr:uncharacterized protein LOC110977675 [Acanthaster planci]